MERQLTDDEFGEQVLNARASALRLELQPVYREPYEDETVARFVAGDPQDPTELDFMRDWYARVRRLTGLGVRIERVRVTEEPPTPYQQWERWISAWSIPAGERIRLLPRSRAYEIGLLPAAGQVDWWLLDDERLIRLYFDDQGNRVRTTTTSDQLAVEQARSWWDLAVTHGALDTPEGALTARP